MLPRRVRARLPMFHRLWGASMTSGKTVWTWSRMRSGCSPSGDGHLLVLAASIRNLEQLLCCFWLDVDLMTVPAKVLRLWAEKALPLPEADFQYFSPAKPIPYEELDLARPWETFNIAHELTTKGLEKFAADYRKTLAESAGGTD
jgi:transaldolase